MSQPTVKNGITRKVFLEGVKAAALLKLMPTLCYATESELQIAVKSLGPSFPITKKETYLEEVSRLYGKQIMTVMRPYLAKKDKLPPHVVKSILAKINSEVLKIKSNNDVRKIQDSLVNHGFYLLFTYENKIALEESLKNKLDLSAVHDLSIYEIKTKRKHSISITLPDGANFSSNFLYFTSRPQNRDSLCCAWSTRSLNIQFSEIRDQGKKLHEGVHTLVREHYGIEPGFEPVKDFSIRLDGYRKTFPMDPYNYHEAIALTAVLIKSPELKESSYGNLAFILSLEKLNPVYHGYVAKMYQDIWDNYVKKKYPGLPKASELAKQTIFDPTPTKSPLNNFLIQMGKKMFTQLSYQRNNFTI